MHKASIVLAAGADFRLLGPDATMLHRSKPVVAVCAARTGCGKSQTSRKVGQALLDAGLEGRARSPSDALRRSRGDARAALRDARGHRRLASDRRGARGVRGTGADGHGHVRRCRLRGDPARSRAGGRRRHLGRRQQRLPVLRPDLLDRRRRSAPARPRAPLPPRRDEPPDGGRRRHQQGRLGRGAQRRAGRRQRRVGQPDGDGRSSPSPPPTLDDGPEPSSASSCWSSTTGRR